MASLLLAAAGIVGVSAFVSAPIGGVRQIPLGGQGAVSDFNCDLPPVLDPSADGLPSAESLFSSHNALLKQVDRLQAIVRVPSICYDDLGGFDEDERWAPFYTLHKVLQTTFPVLHERATVEKVNRFGLIYTIEGSDPSLEPVLLAAHQDVVPVPDESTWTHPPFDAYFDGEYVWGRGSSDDKNSLTAILSAVETLLSNSDWTPKRSFVLAFGFDEECSGYRGAAHIDQVLTERYGENGLAMILDEGGLGIMAIGDTVYALPAVMEKGHVDIWMTLRVNGGHSSVPLPHTGIGIISEIVTALEANPYEPQLLKGSPVYNHMVCIARHSPNVMPKIAELIEKGDLSGLAEEISGTSPIGRYLIQTSQAVDIIEAGAKINAMPEVVTLGVNYRIAPQDSIPKVQHNVVKFIDEVVKKYNLDVQAFEGDEEYADYVRERFPEDMAMAEYEVDYNGTLILVASEASKVTPVAPTSDAVWDVFSGTVQHTLAVEGGTVVPVGEIMTGNTDTRHYLNLSPKIYRWTPNRERGDDHIHTVDERIRMTSHLEVVRLYYDLIRNFDAADF